MISRIVIDMIPHKDQRYPTLGDWQFCPVGDATELRIRVSQTGDTRSDVLIAVHELVEAILCRAHKIRQEDVDRWDMGPGKSLEEPGADPKAPYHAEHMFAEQIERLVADAMHFLWAQHEAICGSIDR